MKENHDQRSKDQTPKASADTSPAATRSFTLTGEEQALIEAVKREESLLSDSAALRRLIRDGYKYRELMREAERHVAEEWVRRSK